MKYQVVLSSHVMSRHIIAIRFIESLIEQGHEILPVFFYRDGVVVANILPVIATDEPDLRKQWQQLVENHGIELRCCVSAANRRGILNAADAAQKGLTKTLDDAFGATGLGDFTANSLKADRVIVF